MTEIRKRRGRKPTRPPRHARRGPFIVLEHTDGGRTEQSYQLRLVVTLNPRHDADLIAYLEQKYEWVQGRPKAEKVSFAAVVLDRLRSGPATETGPGMTPEAVRAADEPDMGGVCEEL